jgi:heat-inducible transcriptional repressor
MPSRLTPRRDLCHRDLEILKDVILAHVLNAEPVSSRTVARFGQTGLSAASVRNIMADLEEWGYLSQPHTSAGRVPTRDGYHLFIDTLMQAEQVPEEKRRYIETHLNEGSGDAEHLAEATSHLLSELTQQVGIVVTPVPGQTVLKTVEFVPLSGRQVLCVVVSTAGFVDNTLIETEKPVEREKLVRISNYLNENFAGLTLVEIRDRLLAKMAEERATMDELMGLAIELARKGLEPKGDQDVLVDGASMLLGQPELSDLGRVRRLLETFSDKARLVQMLNECIRGEGVRVLIGEDSDLTSELDFSLVATTYGTDRAAGALGIFGPARMEYPKVIPLVHYLGNRLSRMLRESFPEVT